MAQVTLEQLTADVWVVSLFGEHDISMVDALRDRLAEAFTNDARLIIDLAETSFVDSTVLGVLFAVIKQATSSAGETLALVVTPGSAVDQTITLTGFTPPIVATYPSRDQVLAAWQDDHHGRPAPRGYPQRS
jgi:anti-anti-sigma factor